MGDYFQTVVDIDAAPEDVEVLASRVVDWLVDEQVVLPEQTFEMLGRPVHSPGRRWDDVMEWPGQGADGLAVVRRRTVFWGSLGSEGAPVCPHCSAPTAETSGLDALAAWNETGSAELWCPACGRSELLPEWTWQDDRFACGHLGFEVWNAARLRPEFVAELGRVLGHRVRKVSGKL
ncbi:hypothetical protein GCM10009730_65330 [Streptomyces albidochromogenes]|uniref:hypothetical protein n=1 Tax=Streptomyces albidochromogenes TaxID=329524 RepID=UPI00110FB4AC|nr:hypothetical protein [Streptomyces albidochromogenes]